jgi:hypothetical protein
MTVLVVYTVLVAIFETIICFVGIAIDAIVPSGWNLIIAMVMFFAVLAVMWPVSVFITERWLMPAEHGKHAARQPAK